jgi:hypothetical protein
MDLLKKKYEAEHGKRKRKNIHTSMCGTAIPMLADTCVM